MLIDNYNIQLNCLVQSQQQKQRSRTQKQHFPDDFQKLLDLISERELTNILEWLEAREIGSEDALGLLKRFRQIEKSPTSFQEVAA